MIPKKQQEIKGGLFEQLAAILKPVSPEELSELINQDTENEVSEEYRHFGEEFYSHE